MSIPDLDKACKTLAAELPGTTVSHYEEMAYNRYIFSIKDNVTGLTNNIAVDGYVFRMTDPIEYLGHQFKILKDTVIKARGEWVGMEWTRTNGRMGRTVYRGEVSLEKVFSTYKQEPKTKIKEPEIKKDLYNNVKDFGIF